ncbi:MAG TPA: glycosyltransferase family 2 protein [Bryobacteraceae bacterium]|jgi:glycosyltransferase involved in cell wall biosynthesis|nr:glycosyltransferase family 2 protein [Bryobacteraceae bacterium]
MQAASATALASEKDALLRDAELELLIPENDVRSPELSIVIPAMNEAITIGMFVEWCKAGLEKAGVVGEILIVDSSKDDTPRIALAGGARVLRSPKRGLGRAYIDAIPFVRSNYILMGDADCTYDFREISQFVQKFRQGYEFIMGSRFKGYIEPAAMPALHRYFGTPLTTSILNLLYGTKFTDIHCGMRGITRDALVRIRLESQSWEYASEMVLKSACLDLHTAEVPVRFLRDQEGRLSHMKRSGWLEPWRAGWINLKSMFLYGADFFLLRPGLIVLLIGLLLTLPEMFGPFSLGPITLSLYWMMFGMTVAVVGLQSFYLGCIAQVLYDYPPKPGERWIRIFSYDRTMIASGILFLAGCAMEVPIAVRYLRMGLRLPVQADMFSHLAVAGLLFLIFGFMTFCFTLILHSVHKHVLTERRARW